MAQLSQWRYLIRVAEPRRETSAAGYKWGAFGEAKCNWLHKGRREAAGISASLKPLDEANTSLPPRHPSFPTHHPLLFCVSRRSNVSRRRCPATKSVNCVVFHDRATSLPPLRTDNERPPRSRALDHWTLTPFPQTRWIRELDDLHQAGGAVG